jgi:CRP/FNR family cyclic AMP-dependent transcriptional regulator
MFTREDPRSEALRSLPLFSGCTRRELETVGSMADEVPLREGVVLTEQGKPGSECFVLLSGGADVTIGRRVVAHVGPGEIVGEMALLESEPRTATVITTERTRVLVMTRPNFTALLEKCPNVSRRVMRTLARRLREVQAA